MTLKRAPYSWLARKAQAPARASRLIPLLLLSVFIVLSSASNIVAQVGWSTPMPSWDGPAPATSVADRCFTGNLNGDSGNPAGDKMTDFWCTTGTGSSTWLIGISNGSGWSVSTTWDGPIPGPPQPVGGTNLLSSCITGDLNGDGKSDIYCQYLVSIFPLVVYSSAGLSTGSGWSTSPWSSLHSTFSLAYQCLTGDLNGDGKTDIWCETFSPGIWSVGISTGIGWATSTWNGPAPVWSIPSGLRVSDQCLTGDLNGDGMTDMWCQIIPGSSTWDIAISTGSGWVTPPNVSGPAPSTPLPSSCLVGDANGDGLVDFWCETSSGSGSWTMALAVEPPPTITSAGTATGQVGVAFSYQMTATNSPSSFDSTGLPAGLALNATSGLIAGTPTSAGASTVTLSATNAGGTGTQTLTVTIVVAPLLP